MVLGNSFVIRKRSRPRAIRAGRLSEHRLRAGFPGAQPEAFVKAYKAKYRRTAALHSADQYAAIQLIAAAVKKANSTDINASTDGIRASRPIRRLASWKCVRVTIRPSGGWHQSDRGRSGRQAGLHIKKIEPGPDIIPPVDPACKSEQTRRRCRSGLGIGAEPLFEARADTVTLPAIPCRIAPPTQTIERRTDVRHRKSCIDDGLHQAAIENVEQLAEFADAAAGRSVDFQLADEHPLQIGRRVGAGGRATGDEPPPRRSDLSDSAQLASPTLSITMSTPPLLISRIAFDTRSV